MGSTTGTKPQAVKDQQDTDDKLNVDGKDSAAGGTGSEAAATAAAQRRGASEPQDGIVIRVGEPARLEAADVDADTFVVVKDNVWQEFYPEGTKRPSHRLLFHKGQHVLKSKLDELAQTPRSQEQAPTGTDEVK